MVHHFQIIVVCDADPARADAQGARAVDWLADQCVIEDEPSSCVPEPARRGHRPDEAWQSAIVEIDERFVQLEVNGVEVETGRRVFEAGRYEPTPYCPKCDRPRGADADWKRTIDTWREGDDDVALTCPHCSQTSKLVDWRHDPPIGFGHLGLVFWNWPSLNREFIERLGNELDSRMLLVEGRL